MSNEIILSKKFEAKNNEVRAYYLEKLETDRNLGIKIDELVEIVHQEHANWSLSKIAQYIVSVNEDLDGFSSRTIYEKMSQEAKVLYGQTTKPKGLPHRKTTRKNRTMFQNNVRESEIEDGFQSNVPEQSSITKLPFTTANEELEKSRNEHGTQPPPKEELKLEIFKANYLFEIKGQELPLIITVDTTNQIILKVELDKKKAKELGVF